MCLGLLAVCPIAQGSIAFSFADPGPGHQLTNTANGGGTGIGRLTYNSTQAISLIVDGTTESAGMLTFNNARLEMTNMNLGAAQTVGGVTTAPVTGGFTFFDFTGNVRTNILTATIPTGSFVRIGNTNALLFSSSQGLVYSPGPALTTFLAGATFANPQEAVFTLTDVVVGGSLPLIGAGGVFNSFTANSSYSGNTATVPAPGSIVLLVLGAGVVAGRRRVRN
jgi:hypothetical protein